MKNSWIVFIWNAVLTWSAACVITSSKGAGTLTVTDTKRYVPVLTLSAHDNAKLLPQLKSGFKRTINWNKYQSKLRIERQNRFLDYVNDLNFQEANRYFVLSFEDNTIRTEHKIFSSNCWNKRLQCYDRWTKLFWSAS